MGLPYIPLHENDIFKATKIRNKEQPPWLEPIPAKKQLEPEKYFSLNDIYNSKFINKRSRITRDNKIKEFKLWLEDRRSRNLYGPSVDELKVEVEKGNK